MPHARKLSLALLLAVSAWSPTRGDHPAQSRGEDRARPPAARSRDGRAEGPARAPLDPKQVGIVVVDMWNYHWCKTAAMRVGALVPRMNRVLDAARGLGMTVMLCPSDVVDNYVGWPQREAIFAMPQASRSRRCSKVDCPSPPGRRRLRLRRGTLRRQLRLGRHAPRPAGSTRTT